MGGRRRSAKEDLQGESEKRRGRDRTCLTRSSESLTACSYRSYLRQVWIRCSGSFAFRTESVHKGQVRSQSQSQLEER